VSSRLVIIGCGGFGREVHDVVDAINRLAPTFEVVGYVDDSPSRANLDLIESRGSTLLGSLDWLSEADQTISYVIGIGSGKVRRAIDRRLLEGGYESSTLIHPDASVGHDVRVGAGSVICAGVRVTTNISIGRHVHLNLNSTIGHDSILEDYVTVNPLVAISGEVRIGAESMVGTHSAVLQRLRIGDRAVVGAGACVVRDVPADAVVKGVPAR